MAKTPTPTNISPTLNGILLGAPNVVLPAFPAAPSVDPGLEATVRSLAAAIASEKQRGQTRPTRLADAKGRAADAKVTLAAAEDAARAARRFGADEPDVAAARTTYAEASAAVAEIESEPDWRDVVRRLQLDLAAALPEFEDAYYGVGRDLQSVIVRRVDVLIAEVIALQSIADAANIRIDARLGRHPITGVEVLPPEDGPLTDFRRRVDEMRMLMRRADRALDV